MQYELFYLIGERQEANLDEIKAKVEGILKAEKANLLDPEVMEKRKLAYEIKHQRKGVYVTRRFELEEKTETEDSKKESGIEKITRQINLMSDVLRFLIVKTDDLPDLGAKERRKAQEIGNQKQPFQKQERPQQQKPEPAPQINEEEKPSEKKEEIAERPIKNESDEGKDIDKQLDKLLDI